MKKFILSLSLVLTLSHSQSSHAVVGAVLLNPPVALVGLAIAGGSAAVFFKSSPRDWTTQLIAAGAFISGATVLEGEQELIFSQITQSDAKTLKLSKQELASYNSEIDQVNMVYKLVQESLSEMKDPTASDAAEIWKTAQELVSPETFSAMLKITQQ